MSSPRSRPPIGYTHWWVPGIPRHHEMGKFRSHISRTKLTPLLCWVPFSVSPHCRVSWSERWKLDTNLTVHYATHAQAASLTSSRFQQQLRCVYVPTFHLCPTVETVFYVLSFVLACQATSSLCANLCCIREFLPYCLFYESRYRVPRGAPCAAATALNRLSITAHTVIFSMATPGPFSPAFGAPGHFWSTSSYRCAV